LDSNTQFLLTGQTSNVTPGQTNVPVITVGALTDNTQARYAIYRSSGQVVDADVALQVVGLRALSSDSNGNIIEG
jgi:predicted enzyme related to lactoylglutathione lyase